MNDADIKLIIGLLLCVLAEQEGFDGAARKFLRVSGFFYIIMSIVIRAAAILHDVAY